jgi:YHS domain-containing protein
MTFIARIMRFLFWLLVLSWGVRLLRYLVYKMFGNIAAGSKPGTDAASRVETPGSSRRLVRDPVCGMHVDEALSIPLRAEGELVHFCSIACRDKYEGSAERKAANG